MKNKNIIPFLFKYPSITLKEIEYLKLLRLGASNQFIAENLNVSIPTVKYHLSNLKQKFSVFYRRELIKLAQDQEFTNLLKLTGDI